LADFQQHIAEFEPFNAQVLAISVDSREDAQEMIETQGLTFPVGYGLDYKEFARLTGAFYEDRRGIIHATGFIIERGGTVVGAVYSSHAIGRYTATDCLRQLNSLRNRNR